MLSIGSGTELNDNKVKIEEFYGKHYLHWTAISEKTAYYSHPAKEYSIEVKCEINIRQFENVIAYYKYCEVSGVTFHG